MFDTHAHVHDAVFDEDRDAMLARARAAGVERILTVGCDLADSARAVTIAQEYGLQASLGIHPHEAKDAPAEFETVFEDLRVRGGARVVAVGETGLDYFYDHSPRDAQLAVLRKHLRYARSLGLPLIFHLRDAPPGVAPCPVNAFDEFVAVLREEPGPLRGVVHCFTGTTQQARIYVGEFGLKLGIGGVMTFKTAHGLREAIVDVGLDHLVLETDAPYLAPVPKRGKRNEPAFVAEVRTALAHLLERSEAEIDERTSRTAAGLFGPPSL